MFSLASSVLLALIPFVVSQTSTTCNPTSEKCPDDPAFPASTTFNFEEEGPSSEWTVLGSGNLITQDSGGLHFTINGEDQAPTLCSVDYLFFGTVTATLEAASGAGIVSAFIMQSDDLDEIDWEWLGGVTTNVQSNYFSKGNTTTYNRSAMENVANPQTTFHTYSINWTPDAIEWIIDGVVLRTLTAASAGSQYPQTPMQVRVGTWCGGCSSEPAGTVQWAGGPTTFTAAPYIMTIQSLTIQNANPGASYTYGDESGLASSIVVNDPSQDGSNTTSSDPPASSSAASSSAASSSSSSSSTDPPSSSTSDSDPPSTTINAAIQTNDLSASQTTVVVQPSSALDTGSGASTLSLGSIIALVFGTIVFLAGI